MKGELKVDIFKCIDDLKSGYTDLKELVDGFETKDINEILEDIKKIVPLVNELESDCGL